MVALAGFGIVSTGALDDVQHGPGGGSVARAVNLIRRAAEVQVRLLMVKGKGAGLTPEAQHVTDGCEWREYAWKEELLQTDAEVEHPRRRQNKIPYL
jgi:hypothetical protein